MTIHLPSVTRRQFFVGASIAASAIWMPRLAFASDVSNRPRIIVFILRGGLDGLHAVPPYGEPSYAPSRGSIAIPAPAGPGTAFKLDAMFGLHPVMDNFYAMFNAGEALVVHATAPPYWDRSHFTAQDILENGTDTRSTPTGWMGRALATRDASLPAPTTIEAITLGSYITPLTLEGAPSASALPDCGAPPSTTVSKDLKVAYQPYPDLAQSYSYMPDLNELASLVPDGNWVNSTSMWSQGGTAGAKLLNLDIGPDVLVYDLSGWDSHQWQGGTTGETANTLQALDDTFGALKTGLGANWKNTAIVAMTEFGRTVDVNGTGGTDHGVGTAAYLLGGAVSGGRVVADWPGLDPSDRYQGRDLQPTTDTRSILKGILIDHWKFSDSMIDQVFPDSDIAPPLEGLIKT